LADTLHGRLIQEGVRAIVGLQQRFDALAQRGISGAGLVQEGGPVGRHWLIQRVEEDRFDRLRVGRHRTSRAYSVGNAT